MKADKPPIATQNNSPIYMQLAARLRQQIIDGQIATGEALPSERDLCAIIGASRVTIRKATELLIEEGLLSRRQGSGTYVTPRIRLPARSLAALARMPKRGARQPIRSG